MSEQSENSTKCDFPYCWCEKQCQLRTGKPKEMKPQSPQVTIIDQQEQIDLLKAVVKQQSKQIEDMEIQNAQMAKELHKKKRWNPFRS